MICVASKCGSNDFNGTTCEIYRHKFIVFVCSLYKSSSSIGGGDSARFTSPLLSYFFFLFSSFVPFAAHILCIFSCTLAFSF